MQVIATSRGNYSHLAKSLGVHFFQDADDFAEEHPEVVILASSILSTEAVLDSLPVQRLKRSTLFVDVLSVKEFPKQLFLSKLPAQVGCSLHATASPHYQSSAHCKLDVCRGILVLLAGESCLSSRSGHALLTNQLSLYPESQGKLLWYKHARQGQCHNLMQVREAAME